MAAISHQNPMHWCGRSLSHVDNVDVLPTHHLYYLGIEATGLVLLTHDASRKVKFENQPYDLATCFFTVSSSSVDVVFFITSDFKTNPDTAFSLLARADISNLGDTGRRLL